MSDFKPVMNYKQAKAKVENLCSELIADIFDGGETFSDFSGILDTVKGEYQDAISDGTSKKQAKEDANQSLIERLVEQLQDKFQSLVDNTFEQ
jgi:hypothetical protein